jgi:hypothetical protein
MSILDRQKPTKINRLLTGWPQGTVATHSWLQQHGVRARVDPAGFGVRHGSIFTLLAKLQVTLQISK